MTTEEMRRRAEQGMPTGIPDNPLAAAQAINEEIGRRVNLPGPDRVGVLLAGGTSADTVGVLAQVSTALALTDIAASLRALSGREDS